VAKLGFKKLTAENWLHPDPVLAPFASLPLTDGTVRQITPEEWVRRITSRELSPAVPQDIQALFEVAKGAMTYGSLFYPLFTLGTEQLYRVLETAVRQKCQRMQAPKSKSTYQKQVDWLMDQAVLDRQDEIRWQGARGLRNLASHPEQQTIIMPGQALDTLYFVAERIDQLLG